MSVGKRLYLIIFVISFVTISCKEELVTPPNIIITDFSPKTGGEKTVVVISGQNFAAIADSNLIKIGKYSLIPLTASTTELSFAIPTGMVAGDYNITVTVAKVSAISTDKFNVDPTNPGSGGFLNNDKVPNITPEIVNNCFFRTGQINIHPRIFYSSADIQRLKSLVVTDMSAKKVYDAIMKSANNYLSQPVLKWGLDDANLRISNIHTIGSDILPTLVLAYQFTSDTRYAQRCYDQLAEMNAFTVGAPTTIKKLEIWKLKPTNQGFREAQKNHIWEPDTK